MQLICQNPPPQVYNGQEAEFGLQDKGGGLLAGTPTTDGLVYDFSVDVRFDHDAPNFLGAYAHGPAASRFLYLSYRLSGSGEWIRRIKVPLTGIPHHLLEMAVQRDQCLYAAVDGRSSGSVTLSAPWSLR